MLHTIKNLYLREYTHQVRWLLIIVSIVLFFIPYILPGNTYKTLGAYPALSTIPVIIGALLKARKGSIITTCSLLLGLAFFNTLETGFPWPSSVLRIWLTGGVGSLTFGLAIGQFSYMRQRLHEAHQHILLAHNDLQTNHEALTEAHEELQLMEEELRSTNEYLADLATKDPLTNLPNHRAINEALSVEVARIQRYNSCCSLLFFDLDHFKALNDTYGHPAGDAALQHVATLAQQVVRSSDVVGRWGGEEFIVLLPETDRVGAVQVAEQLCAHVADALLPIGGGVHMTCSIGVAHFPQDARDAAGFIEAADHAMYAAKKLGRNQVRCADDPAVKAIAEPVSGTASREEQVLLGTVQALAQIIEARDPHMGAHSHTVGKLTVQVARALGITATEAHMIQVAGALHDVGKVAIEDAILRKPGKLTPDEWSLIHRHPEIGATMLSHIPALRPIVSMVLAHHERWDGQGYPNKLEGDAIPLGARIIAAVDAFDAMTTDRPYRQAMATHQALRELRRCAGSQFDPVVIDALERIVLLSTPLVSPEQQAA